jgi:hypothetical protein
VLHIELAIRNDTGQWSTMRAADERPAKLSLSDGTTVDCKTVLVGTGGHRLAPGFQVRGFTRSEGGEPVTELIQVDCEGAAAAAGSTLSLEYFYFLGEVDYYVEMPGTASVRIGNTNGRISVRQIAGRVEAETTNGGVEGRGLTGTVKASTTNGGVDVEVAVLHQDGVTLETVNGGVRLALPDSAKADISATTVNGGISTSGLSVDSTESSRRRLEGRINGGGARIRLEVVNGGVRLEGRSGS